MDSISFQPSVRYPCRRLVLHAYIVNDTSVASQHAVFVFFLSGDTVFGSLACFCICSLTRRTALLRRFD